MLALSAVLVVQCLLFADGGLLALGANIFNMGLIPCLVVYSLLFCPIVRRGLSHRRLTLAALSSALVSAEAGALCVTLQTLASGVTELPFAAFAALMLPIHLVIGATEGLATTAVLNFVLKVRPELLTSFGGWGSTAAKRAARVKVALVGATLAVAMAGGVSLLASSKSDGLEWSMERTAGGAELERTSDVYSAAQSAQEATALLEDYELPEGGGTGEAGLVEAVITCSLVAASALIISAVRQMRQRNASRR